MLPTDLIDRVYRGECTKEDAALLAIAPPAELFGLADELRAEAVGDVVTYIPNRNINFTNRCIGTCRFCAFKEPDGYRLGIPEILRKVEDAVSVGATEICIQGGLLPDMHLTNYCEILESVKSEFPAIHLHAYSPMEVWYAAGGGRGGRGSGSEDRDGDGAGVRDTLAALKKAGLDTMPGTAAEILVDDVRTKICPDKLNTEQWTGVVRTAHSLGIRTTATIMYGHIETVRDRIDHLFLIRDLQDETHGFTEFVPLSFMPYNNELGEGMLAGGNYGNTGIDDLRMHALARIVLHRRIPNIQASWVKLGKKLAQYALHCGANDLGGTLMEEKISKSAGSMSGEYMPPSEFNWIIENAGRIPRVRDTLYSHQQPPKQGQGR
ncbi:MAG: 5-amino-6-(D-ribitylamino)uracil--L-tyrosine 4-hydroxyphenyl transferase CofH [Methanosarcinales archaeon]|nr:5-amino-6-(D-ribitylamino)uracil--L-tyrosine 4-hydroxyphenyl transferase CofH [Methanosarcinales archaeon]